MAVLVLFIFIVAGCAAAPAPIANATAGTASADLTPPSATKPATTAPATPEAAINLTQSAEAGAVTVEITPLNLNDPDATTLDFAVAMNTHSVELGVDLAKMAALIAGDAEVPAQTWLAPAGGGHHVEGTLSFPASIDGMSILGDAQSLTVVIRDLADIAERTFTWDMTQISAMTLGMMADSQMGAGQAMTGTMPMSGMMDDDMMGMMEEMMAQMSPEQRQQMMQHMMEIMGGSGGMMEHDMGSMMDGDMMGMMSGMMAQMSPEQRQQMMQHMMEMMGGSGDMQGHQMGSGEAMTGTMPMDGNRMGMMGDMGNMEEMMAMMQNMSPAERQKMMADMMAQMQGMMGDMKDMPDAEHQQMMQGMMGMMSGMMNMMGDMKDMPAAEHQQMMDEMMEMMSEMQGMMGSGHEGMDMQGMDMQGMDGAMGEHMAPIPSAGVPDAIATVGGQPLDFKLEDGVKVFELTAQPVRWSILDGVTVTAWTYNGTVPGPMIRVTAGDRVRIVLKNELPEATSIHWHGLPVPNAMDGMTPIPPGESFTYEFTAPPAGSFMYHSHISSDKQVTVGMYAPFIVDPQRPERNPPAVDVSWMLSEWRVGPDGATYAAMPMAGAEPNYFTINGKSYPNTQAIEVKKGERVRIRLAAIGQFTHPMHLHGMNFKVVAMDGVPLPPEQQVVRNTIPVNPGELIDIEFTAENVGEWMFHCHILHHVTNDNVEPGGLLALVKVTE